MAEHPLISRFLDLLVRRIASGFKIPEPALRMFRTANELSGLDRKTLPTELIPLNTIQISRGLLNFTLLQSLAGWVLPYWADRQYDPEDRGFIPRSHLGLSMNVTRRNWTAVGSHGCTTEPVVDPRGAVMPWRNRWTTECWLKQGEDVYFPSRSATVRQSLREGLPIVETLHSTGPIRMEQTHYVDGTTLIGEVSLRNTGSSPLECTMALAVRPFNAEGACLLHRIRFDEAANAFVMDECERLFLPGPPDAVRCSNHAGGDSAASFAPADGPRVAAPEAVCPSGLANGYAAYGITLGPGGSRTFRTAVCLEGGSPSASGADHVASAWERLLGSGTIIVTPDRHIDSILRASVSTLLLLTDGDSITPGPWTYHQFWFRDAAIMLRALDVFAFHSEVRAVIRSFPVRQESSGYYRSQQGEWDSNGQALWTVWEHALLSGDVAIAREIAESMEKGALWIVRKRHERDDERTSRGLLPPGLSAEHLGLADRYFWDNWWSVAGLEAYARLCALRGMQPAEGRWRREIAAYREDIEREIARAQEEQGIDVIPAGPSRGIDCGMIGSCAPWYPLQQYDPQDARMRRTLEALSGRYFLHGLFFQEFIHSGKNPYLTLQIAQSWLYAGERERFWTMFTDVIRHASRTLNYPEAIHPLTGGGTMGDGHHGWAAAEIALALRNAFVREAWTPAREIPGLVLLGGIPREWFMPGASFAIRRAPVPGGIMSIEGVSTEEKLTVEIDYQKNAEWGAREWRLELPVGGSRITVNGHAAHAVALSGGTTSLLQSASPGRTVVAIERYVENAPSTVQTGSRSRTR
ncbi:MAG TPA: hypothetical protein VMF59_11585 [Bacteroidota bacterium]|nr:hypothetical protein [Bacteroidota bacterium]